MLAEIRAELRGILRRMDELRRPMTPELAIDPSEAELPYVLRRMASHEAIQEDVISLAGMVWHLKDRLNRWMSAVGKTCVPSIEEIAAAQKPLLICGDLIDSKKHGGGSNRSGFAPQVGEIGFSQDGRIGFRYDGALKLSDIRLEKPTPIPFTVDIVSGDGQFTFGPAVDLISKAFENWRILIEVTGLLGGGDPESQELRRLLERFEKGATPIFHSKLIG
jgi:hypothetical protein